MTARSFRAHAFVFSREQLLGVGAHLAAKPTKHAVFCDHALIFAFGQAKSGRRRSAGSACSNNGLLFGPMPNLTRTKSFCFHARSPSCAFLRIRLWDIQANSAGFIARRLGGASCASR